MPEQWTSILCHRWGHKGIRPKQNLFICHTCGYCANADFNGAINIGRRVIKLIPHLENERGLGMWLLSKERVTPKVRRSSCSKLKSSLPQRLPTSLEGESVVDCYGQVSLKKSGRSSDLAMEKTVDTPSAVVSSGTHDTQVQRTEVRS